MNKVVLILVDGMRPDSLSACANPYVTELLNHSRYTLTGRTVMPSVTLPCHVSLFHSVPAERHGIMTNVYTPQVRPIRGLCEVLSGAGKRCAMLYNWEPLRDLSRPGSLEYAFFNRGKTIGWEVSNRVLTEQAIDLLAQNAPDFTFLYLGWADEAGHAHGWMSDEYLRAVHESFQSIQQVIAALNDDFLTIVTADHGGHDRHHGTEMDEDMLIPIILHHPSFAAGQLSQASILDLAPTIATTCGVPTDPDWEGKPLPL